MPAPPRRHPALPLRRGSWNRARVGRESARAHLISWNHPPLRGCASRTIWLISSRRGGYCETTRFPETLDCFVWPTLPRNRVAVFHSRSSRSLLAFGILARRRSRRRPRRSMVGRGNAAERHRLRGSAPVLSEVSMGCRSVHSHEPTSPGRLFPLAPGHTHFWRSDQGVIVSAIHTKDHRPVLTPASNDRHGLNFDQQLGLDEGRCGDRRA